MCVRKVCVCEEGVCMCEGGICEGGMYQKMFIWPFMVMATLQGVITFLYRPEDTSLCMPNNVVAMQPWIKLSYYSTCRH